MISLSTAVTFLVFCQALGALVGAVTAVWAEMAYVKAMRDGKVSTAERAHLAIIGHGLRYGMTLLLLSSLGLIVVAYLGHATTQPAVSSGYWLLVILALIVISTSSAFARQRMPFKLASATLFTAWWFLVYLSFGWIELSFGAALMSFVVAAFMLYAVLFCARLLALP